MTEEDVIARVDAASSEWRQGDAVLGENWFLFKLDPSFPLTEPAHNASEAGLWAAEESVQGLMVVTQTCDIVRSCRNRPFLQVAPLIEVTPGFFHEVARGYRPQFAAPSGLEEHGLVADLDRIMTVEKALLLGWARVAGCNREADRRHLSLALARKRARVAFPDDFAEFADPLRRRVSAKHDKNSQEGRALRGLREIRVRAAPSWDAENVEITIFFIREDNQSSFEGRSWDKLLESWLDLLPEGSRFRPQGLVVALEDLGARDYAESDPLDLDYLSGRPE